MSLDSAQLTQALRALYTYINRKSANASPSSSTTTPLFDDDQFIHLQVSLKRTPNRSTTKPYPLPLPHPLYTADTELCLITKDPPRVKDHPTALSTTTAPNAIKQYFAAHPVAGLSRVIGVTKLRKEYGRFKERRELLALYDLFLADDRILPLLPAVLGVKFFDKKKQPIPVDLTRTAKDKSIRAALHSTYMYVPTGSSLQVKVGRSSMSRQHVYENVMAVVGRLVERLPGKWRGVQMLGVKCGDSITIPVYQSLPLQAIGGGGVDVPNGESETQDEDEEEAPLDGLDDGDEDADEAVELPITPASKAMEAGKKRKRNDMGENSKTPASATRTKTPLRTPGSTPLAATPTRPRSATPKQSNGVSAGKRVVAVPPMDEDEDEDELEVTLHPDLLDDGADDDQRPTATPKLSNKKAKHSNGTAATTPRSARAHTAITPVRAARTPAKSPGTASTAPVTPNTATEAAGKKGRRAEDERKEAAEEQSPAATRSTQTASRAKASPATTPKRKRSADEAEIEQSEETVTPVARRDAGSSAQRTPATTRTASKASEPVVHAEQDENEQTAMVRPASKARKEASGRLSLPAKVAAVKSAKTKAAPASTRKSKA